MKWLRKRLLSWLNDDSYIMESTQMASRKYNSISTGGGDDLEGLSSEPLRLNIYRANGGTIVETKQYDRQKDRTINQLHIVSNDQDLGESLSKIITLESLRG